MRHVYDEGAPQIQLIENASTSYDQNGGKHPLIFTYSDIRLDKMGNWLERKQTIPDPDGEEPSIYLERRKITNF